jgi:hypothetical protein
MGTETHGFFIDSGLANMVWQLVFSYASFVVVSFPVAFARGTLQKHSNEGR